MPPCRVAESNSVAINVPDFAKASTGEIESLIKSSLKSVFDPSVALCVGGYEQTVLGTICFLLDAEKTKDLDASAQLWGLMPWHGIKP